MMPVNVRVVRGEGGVVLVRVHYFVRGAGPIRNGSITRRGPRGPMVLGGGRGHVACQPGRQQLSVVANGQHQPFPCTDHAPAVTCPECKATADFQKANGAERGIPGGATRNGGPLHGAVRRG